MSTLRIALPKQLREAARSGDRVSDVSGLLRIERAILLENDRIPRPVDHRALVGEVPGEGLAGRGFERDAVAKPASSAKRLNSAGTPPIPSPLRSLDAVLAIGHHVRHRAEGEAVADEQDRCAAAGLHQARRRREDAIIARPCQAFARRGHSRPPCAGALLHRRCPLPPPNRRRSRGSGSS